jgi:hypothetical protein
VAVIELVKWRYAGKAYLTEVGTLTVVISVHPNGGWKWCTNHANGPSGYDPGLASAKTNAVEFTKLWLADRVNVAMSRAPIPWEELEDEHDETADIVAEAVAQERAAVVAWLREKAEGMPDLWAVTATAYHLAANTFEDGEHRREEGA